MKLVTSAQMQEIDRRTQAEFSISGESLMESAAAAGWRSLCEWLREHSTAVVEPGEVLFFCGKGNNGGDALVMARYAKLEGYHPHVILCVPRKKITGLVERHLAACEALEIPTTEYAQHERETTLQLQSASLVIDGLAGTGISGRLRPPMDAAVASINACAALVIAVDTPSGITDGWNTSDPAVTADVTLSMGLPKRCLYQPESRSKCGRVLHVPVPFPDALTGDPTLRGELMLPTEICSSLPALSESAYKKRRGTVTVFAGERGKAGAAMLASEAALAARAGLVHLIVDTELYSSVASAEKAVMVHPRSEAWEREPSYECLLVGCGWGVSLHRRILLPRLLGSSIRGVVDADGLNLLATMPRRPLGNDWVLTPHIGELARLLQCSTSEVSGDLVETTIEAAKAWQCVVVGKSHVVAIASPDGDHLVVDGMNTAMGTGGSGDVLAGIVAGLLANGMSGIDAARYGVGLHQRAGSLLREHAGFFSADRLVLQVAKLSDRPGE